MQLLDQIIEAGTADVPPPLTSVLRQCIVLANELKTPLLRTWAEQELNGYPTPQDVPDYRIVHVGSQGTFQGSFGGGYNRRPIPASLLEEDHRPLAQVVHLTQPVSAYESVGDAQGALTYYWPADMIAYYQEKLLRQHILLTAWQEVPKTVIAGVLDTIRTRVLMMAIDIKNEFDASGADLNKIKQNSPEAEKVHQTVINNIFHGAVNIAGGDQVISTQNITIAKWEDLRKVLKADGIGDGELTELSQAIEKDGNKFGSGVKGWISRNAEKVFDQGLQATFAVGTTILTSKIKQCLGIP